MSQKKGKKSTLTPADIKKYPSNKIDHVILKIKANEKKYTLITVTIILAVSIVSLYFVFSAVERGMIHNNLKDGDLSYNFSDVDNGFGDVINLVNVKPLSDSAGLTTKEYKIKIKNESNSPRKFKIYIMDDLEMIKFDNCSSYVTNRKYIRYSINNNLPNNLDEDMEKEILTSNIKGNSLKTFTIRVWVDENYQELNPPHYHGRIVIKQIKNS